MAQVRLASWYDGHAPGDVIDVADEQVRPLTRDGRVAEVLREQPNPEPAPTAGTEPAPVEEPPLKPLAGLPRRRRKAEE